MGDDSGWSEQLSCTAVVPALLAGPGAFARWDLAGARHVRQVAHRGFAVIPAATAKVASAVVGRRNRCPGLNGQLGGAWSRHISQLLHNPTDCPFAALGVQ